MNFTVSGAVPEVVLGVNEATGGMRSVTVIVLAGVTSVVLLPDEFVTHIDMEGCHKCNFRNSWHLGQAGFVLLFIV